MMSRWLTFIMLVTLTVVLTVELVAAGSSP
jgi:hypothetical protein